MDAVDNKYLTFNLGGSQYGVPLDRVNQITGLNGITQVPVTPRTIKGFLNLKGKVIPVMDLRAKLGLEERPLNGRTYVIVTRVELESLKKQVGIVVDEVSGVQDFQKDEGMYKEENRGQDGPAYLMGMARTEETEIMILDPSKLFNAEEINLLMQT